MQTTNGRRATSVALGLGALAAVVFVARCGAALEFQGETWTGDGAIWSAPEGVLRGVAQEGADVGDLLLRRDQQLPGECSLRFELKLGAADGAVAFRTSPPDELPRGYRLSFAGAALELRDLNGAVLARSGEKMVVDKQGRPNLVRRTSDAPKIALERWHRIQIRAVTNHIAVDVDGRGALELVDQRYHLRSMSGGLQFECGGRPGASMEVRNLVIEPVPGFYPPYEADDAAALLAAGPLPAAEIHLPEGFAAELIYEAPRDTQGSWVAMTIDHAGRIIGADHYGRLYRLSLSAAGRVERAETIDVDLGHAQGLACAGDVLYVMVNGSVAQGIGLYRVVDSDGDDQYDDSRRVTPLVGGGDHGVHGVVLSPDGQSLYMIAGNDAPPPEPLASSAVPQVWQDDLVLPRLSDPTSFATWTKPPNGWICQTDLNGQNIRLVAVGLRNAYDLAFNAAGELFTYDSDMEYDRGLPWYRSPRVLHVTSGAEFGYRHGSGKWPDYYPDSVATVAETGPASPTGVVFGHAANFPEEYRRAMFALDWAYGRIYAIHLRPRGSSYEGEVETFASGKPLPVTDAAIGPDGALYFTTGGRDAHTGVYRVRYEGRSVAASSPAAGDHGAALRKRQRLEQFHRPLSEPGPAIVAAWAALGADRATQFAARTVLEHQAPDAWREQALTEEEPLAAIGALTALVRVGTGKDGALDDRLASRLATLPWSTLDAETRIAALRLCGLAWTRSKSQDPVRWQPLLAELEAQYPTGEQRADRELCALLTALGSQNVVAKTLPLLTAADEAQQQIALAVSLRLARNGWSAAGRREYFQWYQRAIAVYQGTATFRDYLRLARDDAAEALAADQRQALAQVLVDPTDSTDSDDGPRRLVAHWTVTDFAAELVAPEEKRSLESGLESFRKAKCLDCHRVGNQGGNAGPDLAGVGGRFSPRELLESIVEPSKVIADLWRAVLVTTVEGQSYIGQKVQEDPTHVTLRVDASRPLVKIARVDIEEIQPSPLSTMPGGLIDVLEREEVLDLLAYLRADPSVRDKVGNDSALP